MRFKLNMMVVVAMAAFVMAGCEKPTEEPPVADDTATPVETPAAPTAPTATPMDPVSATKWTEGKTAAGGIATSIKLYYAMQQGEGTYGANLPTLADLEMSPSALKGKYFDSTNYSWVTARDETSGALTYAITIARPAGLGGPLTMTLDQSGTWTP